MDIDERTVPVALLELCSVAATFWSEAVLEGTNAGLKWLALPVARWMEVEACRKWQFEVPLPID